MHRNERCREADDDAEVKSQAEGAADLRQHHSLLSVHGPKKVLFYSVFHPCSCSASYLQFNLHYMVPRTGFYRMNQSRNHHLAVVGHKVKIVRGTSRGSSDERLQVSNVGSCFGGDRGSVVLVDDHQASVPQVHYNRLLPLEQMCLMDNQTTTVSMKCHSSSLKIAECSHEVGTKSVIQNSVPGSTSLNDSSPLCTSSVSYDHSTSISGRDMSELIVKNGNQQDEARDSRPNIDNQTIGDSIESKKFPYKLWSLINDKSVHCIHWDDSGKVLIIQLPEFQNQLLPSKTFTTSQYSSFVRQLNIYGFRKVRESELESNAKVVGFQHEYFIRGNESLLKLIKRGLNKTNSRRKPVIRSKRNKIEADKNCEYLIGPPLFYRDETTHQALDLSSSSSGYGEEMELNELSDLSDEYNCECGYDYEDVRHYEQLADGKRQVRSRPRVLFISDQQEMRWRRRWDQVMTIFEDEIVSEMSKEDEILKFIDSLI